MSLSFSAIIFPSSSEFMSVSSRNYWFLCLVFFICSDIYNYLCHLLFLHEVSMILVYILQNFITIVEKSKLYKPFQSGL
jgi:hypothetical protein